MQGEMWKPRARAVLSAVGEGKEYLEKIKKRTLTVEREEQCRVSAGG